MGTWTNGKPLYNEIIYCKSPSTLNSWATVKDVSGLNIDELIHISGIQMNIINAWRPLTETGTDIRVTNAFMLQAYNGNNNWTNKNMIIQLLHTKTTDTI